MKTSWKRLEDILKTFWRRFCKTPWRRFEDVLTRRLEDAFKMYDQDNYLVFIKTSSEDVLVRRIFSSWSRLLEDVFIKTKVCWEGAGNRMMDKIQRVVNMAKRQSQPISRISNDTYLYSKDVELSQFQFLFVPERVLVNYQDFYTLLKSW